MDRAPVDRARSPIISCGEALVDLVPARLESRRCFLPLLGGSPFNVACGLGRLGAPAAFAGAVSSDPFGDELVARLEACSVSLEHLQRLDRPSTLSVVGRAEGAEGAERYGFYSAGAADRHYRPVSLEAIVASAAAVHVGSNSLVLDPAAEVFASLAAAAAGRALVSLDPNVRPSLVDDPACYLGRFRGVLASCDLCKLSAEDLGFLRPGVEPEQAAKDLLGAGPVLVVLTDGARGAVAFSSELAVRQPAAPTELLDTIGAGDGFTAGLLARLFELGLTSRGALAAITSEQLASALGLASAVAAAVCRRRGAEMPARAELVLG